MAVWVAVGLTRLEVDSELHSLLPADDPTVEALDSMAETFGGDPIVVLVEGGGDPLGEDRLLDLLRLEGELSAVDGVVATYGPATTLNQTVLQIKRMIAELMGQRDALEQAGLTKELRLFDQRYGALLVEAMPAGLPTLSNPAFVQSVVLDQETQRPQPQWLQYLPQPETVAIYLRPREGLDQAAAARLTADVRAVVEDSGAVPADADVTVTGVPVVTVGLADQLRSEVPKLAIAAFAVVAAALLFVPWTRRRRWRLAPLLVMVGATTGTLAWFGWREEPLSIGAATFLPIILGLGSYYPVYLARPGHRRVVLAVAVSAALAFGGLLLSPLPFVRQLGLAVPLGLGLVVALTMASVWVRGGSAAEQVEDSRPAPSRSSVPTVVLVGLAAIAVIASAIGWSALSSASLRTDPQQLLAGLPALDDAVHVEDVLSYSAEIDVRLRGPDVLSPEALAWSRDAERQVVAAYGDRVRPVVTVSQLLAFLGEDPTKQQIRAGLAALPAYVTSAVVSTDRHQALTSYGVAWEELARDRSLVTGIRDALPPPPEGYTVEVSGLPVAAERGYELVDAERYQPNLVALLAAFLALVVLLPQRRDAVVAVLAAAIATGSTLAVMTLAVGALNPLTLALGALTAAIGAEFTVLLLAADRSGDRALRRSVWLAALLSLCGYGVLLASSLPVLRELGLALTTSVALSVATALLLAGIRARTTRRTIEPELAAAPDDSARLQLTGGPR